MICNVNFVHLNVLPAFNKQQVEICLYHKYFFQMIAQYVPQHIIFKKQAAHFIAQPTFIKIWRINYVSRLANLLIHLITNATLSAPINIMEMLIPTDVRLVH